MRAFFSLCLFFLFTWHVATGNKFIRDTCKLITEDDADVKSYYFCTASFQAAWKGSQEPSLQTLGSISINLIHQNISNSMSYIQVLKTRWPGQYLSGLSNCLELYSSAKDDLEEAMEDYKSKEYKEVNVKVRAVINFVDTCEDGFKERGLDSPLRERFSDASKLSSIALGILILLQKQP